MSTYCNRQNRICGFGGGMNMGSKYTMDDRSNRQILKICFHLDVWIQYPRKYNSCYTLLYIIEMPCGLAYPGLVEWSCRDFTIDRLIL